jgi:RNA polymerase sigma-70 factor (ECF subfamily)
LVHEALAGNQRAIQELLDGLTPVIHVRVARVLLRRRSAASQRDIRQDVEDFVQEVLVSLFQNDGRKLRQWNPERGLSLESFAGLIAEHEVSGTLRRPTKNPWTQEATDPNEIELPADSEKSPERMTISQDFAKAVLDKTRSSLSELGLEMFKLLILEGLSTEEARAVTGLTAAAIDAWRSRLLRLVRTIAADLSKLE